jgi:hypothetical protein
MAVLQRVDLLLPMGLLKSIKKAAKERRTTFSHLVRESLQLRFPSLASRTSRLAAVERLKGMSLPVGPWARMETQIHKGRTA